MKIKKPSKKKTLTHEKALREIRKFAKEHQRITNSVIINHFKLKGYTHYSAMISGGWVLKYHDVDIENAKFNQVFNKLQDEGVIDKSAKSSRRWNSLVFEE